MSKLFQSARKTKKTEVVRIEQSPVDTPLKTIQPLKFRQGRHTPSGKLFNSLIDQYHYLSHSQPAGENLKYIFTPMTNLETLCLQKKLCSI
ncbi:MAG TPA: DUF4338 domain-containing protein [Thermoplasmata archaeon]|nr:DUF4338 domain-containing protein [Thermoplasmata archaeon]